MRTFALMPLLSFLVFFLGVFIGATFFPGWNPEDYTLSDLGRHSNQMSSLFFNGGCWLSGIILAAGGVGKSKAEGGLNRLAGISLAISGMGLFALGFATSDYHDIHDFTTFVIFIFAIIAMFLATLSDALDKDKFVVIASLVILIVMLLLRPVSLSGTGEIILISGAAAWSAVQIYKYHRNERSLSC